MIGCEGLSSNDLVFFDAVSGKEGLLVRRGHRGIWIDIEGYVAT